MRRRWALPLLAGAFLSGCGRYADFSLPPLHPSGVTAPFTWHASTEPVLTRGQSGEWDSVDVLNPSVVLFHGTYWNFYSGFDGRTWHTGAATSMDGMHWEKRGRVISPSGWEGSYIAANGTALAEGDGFYYWYQAGDPPQIALARSSDGLHWQKHGDAVLPPGPRGSWDESGVADPYVIHYEGGFYLFYLGMNRARQQRIGIAHSTDGVIWYKLRSNPIVDLGGPGTFDENGLGEPAVWSSNGTYWMLYTGRDYLEHRRIGMARSNDGVHWQREPSLVPIAGAQSWDSAVVCDPTVEMVPEGVRVWFGGGDLPRPDQGIHGQIGMAMLTGSK